MQGWAVWAVWAGWGRKRGIPWVCGLLAALALSACGGGGGGGGGGGAPTGGASGTTADAGPGAACPARDSRTFLWLEFRESYLWKALRPDADPAPEQSVDAYFRASLYRGGATGSSVPADRYSGYQSAEAYSRFFGEGNTLGYGLAVAGQEIRGRPDQPLWIRDVTPGSPAALAGLQRGDRVRELNGRSAEAVVAADDFSALTADTEGQTLRITVERDAQQRSATLTSAIHAVNPVRHWRVLSLPDGRRVGWLRYQSMIALADAQLAEIFARFRDEAVVSVILDLRYNGGGSVAVGQRLASHMAGSGVDGQLYAELRYNADQQSRNSRYRFAHTLNWQGVKTVYVLTGSRTCSASEQVISGLRGVGLDVVTIGSTTCGKPVGFSPVTYCGTTYSIVNFESINARGEGAYYAGFPARCSVAEDFRMSMEDPAEPLTAAALMHAQGRGCPATSGPLQTDRRAQAALQRALTPLTDGPEVPGWMVR